MAPVKKSISNRHATFLKAWRTYRQLSQEKAAEIVGVDRTTVGRIEKGEIPYNQDILERLAFAYSCEVDDLLLVDPLKPDPPRLIYQRLRNASPELQKQMLVVLDAMLKAS